jgi:beta-lactamase regulating signal transducer with metallopeptidase domain
MAAWSQSPFLQALGWAMLNSFWQMALLYTIVSVLPYVVPLSSKKRYFLGLTCMAAGVACFAYTFFSFYQKGGAFTLASGYTMVPTSYTWQIVLSSASVAYLLLLSLPAYRLFKKWKYIEDLKKFGLQKTAMEYRLFVKKVAVRLGIKHTVHVYLSELVKSPVTIGYLKPIILLPIAAINSLSPQQVEAVLLHELSHIKRYDYLVNFIITLVQTLFYFNPFVKRLVCSIAFEREKCCDELVVQFQYDKISYATALLLLEKNLLATESLSLPAAEKKNLLSRIQKIVGVETRPRLSFQNFTGLLASFLVVLCFNSLLFVKSKSTLQENSAFTAFENPLYHFDPAPEADPQQAFSNPHVRTRVAKTQLHASKPKKIENELVEDIAIYELVEEEPFEAAPAFIPVSYDRIDDLVSAEEEQQIAQTLETTKKVLTKTKWKEVEASIGDGMTRAEKKHAKVEYLQEVDKIDWRTLETHLKTEYEQLNWAEIQYKMNTAIFDLQLDSLQNIYNQVLSQIRSTESKLAAVQGKTVVLPVPDVSVVEVQLLKQDLRCKLDSIKVVRHQRKIVDL